MAETVTNLPIKKEAKPRTSFARTWYPIDDLRQEIERLFDDFGNGIWPTAFQRSLTKYQPFGQFDQAMAPAVDIAEKDNEYEITAEVPGLDEKDIEVKLVDGGLLIQGEKKVEKEEKKKDYVLSERQYGSFKRYFGLPDNIEADKISATFTKGVLKVSVPKAVDARKLPKTIPVKAA